MKNKITDIYSLLQELTWHFGNSGLNGECCENLSLVEFMALKKIYENNYITIQETGIALNFTKSGATRIIDRLENKGYVVRQHSPIDGRVCCVAVTDKGRKIITKILTKYTNYLYEIFKDLEPHMVDTIKDALGVLVESIHRKSS